jgi:predicted transposase YdaD
VVEIFGGDHSMHESVTYQKVVEEGRAEGFVEGLVEGEQWIIARQATLRFGPPDEATRARLEAIHDPDRLEALAERILTATGWDDLLDLDAAGPPDQPEPR